MQLEKTLNQILPPIAGVFVHVTGEFGEPRPNGKIHKGIDFNYIGGQTGINLTHPKIYSPVSGKVTFVGGNFGTIKIKDSQGYSHELLHTHTQKIKVGQIINLGDELGTMGGKGPLGYHQYPQHVHYQIKDTHGEIKNPHIWWEKHVDLVQEENHLSELSLSLVFSGIELKKSSSLVYQDIISNDRQLLAEQEIKPVIGVAMQENSLMAFDVHAEVYGLV